MSRNGSGTYSLPAGNPVVTGTTITTTWANNTLTDIANTLTGSVASDGQTPMTGALNMGSNKVIALATPTVATDAATKAYVDLTQTASAITGGTITGATLTADTIDNTPIGSTTRSSVKATTLDLGLSTQSVAIGQGNASLMKNRIINGAMTIDQRNAGASVSATTAYQYTVDRFKNYGSVSGKFTSQQNAGSVTPPVGFTNYLGNTSSSAYSIGSGDEFIIAQVIEGYNIADLAWGTANAKTVTLSFWAYSSLTGTFGGALRNSANTRSYPYSYSIPVANTWTQISITIAGDTSGTWATNNTAGIQVFWGLGVGSTYSGTAGTWAGTAYDSATGATSVVGTNGATFYITGVQLEVGSSATGFEYRQYQQELALCQRYLPAFMNSGIIGGGGTVRTTTVAAVSVQFPVQTRVAPTGITTNTSTGVAYAAIAAGGGDFTNMAITFSSASNMNSNLLFTNGAATMTVGQGIQASLASSGYVYFTGCEL